MNKRIYISSCAEDGGIYACDLSADGKLTVKAKTDIPKPMYTAAQGNMLHVLLREPFGEGNGSGYAVYKMNADGTLSQRSALVSTHGKEACHLCVTETATYCTNYTSGSTVKLPDTVVTNEGKGPHPTRQTMPHTHFVTEAPDGHILVCDLGLDAIWVYDPDLTLVSKASVPAGHGARHLVFSHDGKTVYCVNELGNTVTVFAYASGSLTAKETYPLLPADFDGESIAAAIRLSADGKYLYVSNRGHDSITCFAVGGETLTRKSITPCGGHWPRDINLFGDFLVCTNEREDSVTVFHVNGEKLTQTDTLRGIKAPLCVM